MSLFSKQLYTPVVENETEIEATESETFVEVTESDVYESMMECSDTISRVITALQITDIMVESNATGLLEADGDEAKKEEEAKKTISTAKNKILATFKKMWESIKNWFLNMLAKIKDTVMYHNKFYAKYKNEITKKAADMKPFEVKVFYDYKDGAYAKFEGWAKAIKAETIRIVAASGEEKMGKSDVRKELLSKLEGGKYETIAAFKAGCEEQLVEKKEKFTVTGSEITKLLGMGSSTTTASVNEVKKLFTIAKESFEAGVKGINGVKDGSELQIASKTFNAGVATIQSLSSWAVGFYNARASYAYRFLRAFLARKEKAEDNKPEAKQESFDSIDSLFESVLANM